MEKHLGWIVGITGALLLGAVSPLLVQSSHQQPQGMTQTTSTPSAVTLAADAATDGTARQDTTVQDTKITSHVREAGVIAKTAVGGGQVHQLSSSQVQGQDVWRVDVTKPQEHWVVTVSKSDYSVLGKQRLV